VKDDLMIEDEVQRVREQHPVQRRDTSPSPDGICVDRLRLNAGL